MKEERSRRSKEIESSKEGGFQAEEQKPYLEGFQAEERDWRDNILFSKKYTEGGEERYEDSHGSRTFNPSADENHKGEKRDECFGKLYQDKDDDKVWWSKEVSGDRAHGGPHWKQFIKKGPKLIHEADVDLEGKIMSKHKSNVGKVIDFNDLIGIK